MSGKGIKKLSSPNPSNGKQAKTPVNTGKSIETFNEKTVAEMNQQRDVAVIFQSKHSEGGISCSAEKVILNSADFKSLTLKPGAFIMIHSTIHDTNEFENANGKPFRCIYRAIPSSGVNQGISLLNKIWSPNFEKIQSKKDIKNRMATVHTDMRK